MHITIIIIVVIIIIIIIIVIVIVITIIIIVIIIIIIIIIIMMSWIRARVSFVLLRSALLCLRGSRAKRKINLELPDIDFDIEKGHANIR